ncbi:MAG TPA: hypothetical protein VEG32_03550 [Clostridia bacterium]|nr:hypothetical protein [Clostridia bacterium]
MATQVAAAAYNDIFVIGTNLGSIPGVEKVYVSKNGKYYSVWTVVRSFERSLRNRIYEVERSLFEHFPGIRFEFSVIEGDETTYLPEADVAYPR